MFRKKKQNKAETIEKAPAEEEKKTEKVLAAKPETTVFRKKDKGEEVPDFDAEAQELPQRNTTEEKKISLDETQEIKMTSKAIDFLKSVDEKEMRKRQRKEWWQSVFAVFTGRKNKKPAESKTIPDDTIRFNPSVTEGLSDDQVAQNVALGLVNHTEDTTGRTFRQIIMENIFSYFNLVTTAIAVILFIFKRYTEALFMWAVIANVIIGIVQGVKAKNTIDKLKLVTAQNVKVVRSGKTKIIPADKLVLDDIYVLNNGDQIPTDSLIENGSMEVNESLLTGESRPVKKGICDTLYAGSFVVSGSAIVRASLVGRYNYAMGIQARAKEFKKPQSEIVTSLNKIIKVIGIAIVPIGLALFLTQFYLSGSNINGLSTIERASNAISYTAGSVVGMIPTGMYLLTSVALCTGVIALGKKNTLVQDLYCIEMLARVNTLCLDKTGTLTDGTMKCTEVLRIDKSAELSKIVGSYLSSFRDTNQTSIALSKAYPLRSDYQARDTIPFSSQRKYSVVTFYDVGTYLLGAPEYIYKAKDRTLAKYIADKQTSGMRVVMLARSDTPIANNEITGKITPVAIFVLQDHVRPQAPETIRWFVNNGVQIKIISGDNPLTASEIAKKCGVPHAEKAISLEGLSIPEVSELVSQYSVFGRVSPEQKAAIVKELKKEGRTVGMTGDGVNDILAMKNADCSIAMANGASSARNVAHLVLLDSNFSHMPDVVGEGRRVINNIQRSSAMFLMKTIFTIAFTIIVLLTYLGPGHHGMTYPFRTNNIAIMEICGIGIPSTLLALQKNDSEIKGHFTANMFSRAIPGAICLLLAIGIDYILKGFNVLDLDSIASLGVFNGASLSGEALLAAQQESFTTLGALSMAVVSLTMVFNCCVPFNSYRLCLYGACIVLALILIFALPFIPAMSDKPTSLSDSIAWNMSIQFTGIDFRYLNKTGLLLLTIYIVGGAGLLNFLIDSFSFMRGEKPKNSLYASLHELPQHHLKAK